VLPRWSVSCRARVSVDGTVIARGTLRVVLLGMHTLPIELRRVRAHAFIVLAVVTLLLGGGCEPAHGFEHDQSPPSQPNGAGGSLGGGAATSAESSASGGASIADAGPRLPDGRLLCGLSGGTCVSDSVSCQNPDPLRDCNPDRDPGGAFCCLDDVADIMCADGHEAVVSTADYDTSCTASSDCIAVPEGNLCLDCLRVCATGFINRSSFSDYEAAILQAVGTTDASHANCNCPALSIPCCLDGKCQNTLQCPEP